METKRRYWSPDDAQSFNQIEYESQKQQSKKRKITQDHDMASNTSSHLPLKIMYSVKQESEMQRKRTEEIETNHVHVISIRPTNTKNSHLPFEVMCSVLEEKRREIEINREIEKVKSWEEKVIKKAEHEERMVFFSGRVRGQQPPAMFLDGQRGSVAEVKCLLQGKTHSELEVLQSQIESQLRSGLANDVEYWVTLLKLIHIYRVKACLKDIHAKVFWKNLEKDHTSLSNSGYDGKNDQLGTGEAEGTGSSCSPELSHGEEIGDNFQLIKKEW